MVTPSLKRLPMTLFLALLGLSWSGRLVWADPSKPTEYQVKAAYLFNFAKFVEWPSTTTVSGNFCVGVLGNDPFDHALDALLAGKSVQGQPLVVRYFTKAEEAKDCQVVFINLNSAQLRSSLVTLSRQPVLTVGDGPEFIRAGGIIGFERIQNTVRFDVNLPAADPAQLKISSQLLKVAHHVRGAPKAPSP